MSLPDALKRRTQESRSFTNERQASAAYDAPDSLGLPFESHVNASQQSCSSYSSLVSYNSGKLLRLLEWSADLVQDCTDALSVTVARVNRKPLDGTVIWSNVMKRV
jgi:hypothetical protein